MMAISGPAIPALACMALGYQRCVWNGFLPMRKAALCLYVQQNAICKAYQLAHHLNMIDILILHDIHIAPSQLEG